MDGEEFAEEMQALQSQLRYPRHQDFGPLLRRLFSILRAGPSTVPTRVEWLMQQFPWERVEAEVLRPQSGMGPGTLEWPDEREPRLGAQLNLLREFAEGRLEGWNFAFDYFGTSSNNIDATLGEMTGALVDPMLDELGRYLARNMDRPVPEGVTAVPASDRIVTIDHNSAPFEATMDGLSRLEGEIAASNSMDDASKERVAAELDAGRRLLKSRTVRLAALGAVLLPALTWLLDVTAGTAVGLAVEALIEQLKLLVPALWP